MFRLETKGPVTYETLVRILQTAKNDAEQMARGGLAQGTTHRGVEKQGVIAEREADRIISDAYETEQAHPGTLYVVTISGHSTTGDGTWVTAEVTTTVPVIGPPVNTSVEIPA